MTQTNWDLDGTDLIKYYSNCPVCGVRHRPGTTLGFSMMNRSCHRKFINKRPPEQERIHRRREAGRIQSLNQISRGGPGR